MSGGVWDLPVVARRHWWPDELGCLLAADVMVATGDVSRVVREKAGVVVHGSQFATPIIQDLRDKRLDLDATAEALHRAQGTDIPNKTTQARAYHAPLAQLVAHQIEAHAPAAAEGSALRALKAKTDDLERAQASSKRMASSSPPRKDHKGRPSAPSAAPATLPEAPSHWPMSCNHHILL